MVSCKKLIKMINNIFCCDGLFTAINNAGQSGFSILVKKDSYDKTFFFRSTI